VLMQAGRLALEWAAQALDLLELSVVQYAALVLVHRFGGIGQGAIGERLGVSKAAMSGIAVALESRGLVERRQNLRNPARRTVHITRAGAELLAQAAEELAVVDRRFHECLDGDAVRALAELPPRELTPIELALRAAAWA